MDLNSFESGYGAGRAAGQRAGGGRESYGAGVYERMELEKRIVELEANLAGVRAVKDRLKAALRDVAPGHEFVNPYEDNAALVTIYREARTRHAEEDARRTKDTSERQAVARKQRDSKQRLGNLAGIVLVVVLVVVAYLVVRR